MSRTSAATVLTALLDGFRVGRALEDGRITVDQARRAMTEPLAVAPAAAAESVVRGDLVAAAR